MNLQDKIKHWIDDVSWRNYRRDTVEALSLILMQNFDILSEHRRNELTARMLELKVST